MQILQHREQVLHYESVDTGLVKFLNGRIFHLCNPFTRCRANSVMLHCCLHESVQIFAIVSIRMALFFYQRRVTRFQTFTAQTVHSSGVYTGPRRSGKFRPTSDQVKTFNTLPFKKLVRFRGSCESERWIPARFFVQSLESWKVTRD